MLSSRNRQRQPLSGFHAAGRRPLDGTEPAEVAVQIFRRHAAKLTQPALESAVVGIDVLHVINAGNNADAGGQIDRAVGNAQGSRGGRQCFTAVCAKDDVLGQDRLESGNMGRIVGAENEIRRVAGAVAGLEHRHLFAGQSVLAGLATPVCAPGDRGPA